MSTDDKNLVFLDPIRTHMFSKFPLSWNGAPFLDKFETLVYGGFLKQFSSIWLEGVMLSRSVTSSHLLETSG